MTPPPEASPPTISAVIISCEEADVLEPCLHSVAPWVDEIVVVDMDSTDGTLEVAQRFTDRIYRHHRLDYGDPARNYALSLARGEWIIMLDPDERVPSKLAAELRRIACTGEADVVSIFCQQIMLGRLTESAGLMDAHHPRFFRQGAVSWPAGVHEVPDLAGQRVVTLPRTADLSIVHDTWRSIPVIMDKIARYAPNDAAQLHARGLTFSPRVMIRDVANEIIGRIVYGKAYEDGLAGVFAALYFAFYRFTIHAALWEADGRPRSHDRSVARSVAYIAFVYRVFALAPHLVLRLAARWPAAALRKRRG